ncbi:MAG: rhodanese-like domain-containing protein [Actinobacteria bacterium]|nr:rhodanese-like domain-containing protein [Actinomycetota bacterium]
MTTTIQDLVTTARARIRNLTPAEVEAHVIGGEATIVDLREPEELDEHGLLAGAFHVPRGLLEFWADPASPLHRPELDPARTTILYCAAGSRSALAVETLQQLGYRDVAHLDGGIEAWKRAGLPVAGLESWHR